MEIKKQTKQKKTFFPSEQTQSDKATLEEENGEGIKRDFCFPKQRAQRSGKSNGHINQFNW